MFSRSVYVPWKMNMMSCVFIGVTARGSSSLIFLLYLKGRGSWWSRKRPRPHSEPLVRKQEASESWSFIKTFAHLSVTGSWSPICVRTCGAHAEEFDSVLMAVLFCYTDGGGTHLGFSGWGELFVPTSSGTFQCRSHCSLSSAFRELPSPARPLRLAPKPFPQP